MSNFNYLDRLIDFKALKGHCTLAERSVISCPLASAIASRNALDYVVKFIYLIRGEEIPRTATLLELIDNRTVDEFIADNELKESLHYIRILGNNAEHRVKVKKSEALLALKNIHFFIGVTLKQLGVIRDYAQFNEDCLVESNDIEEVCIVNNEINAQDGASYITSHNKRSTLEYIKPQFMSEANTRKLYIDLYLREAGWKIAEREDVVVPAGAGIEIRVEGMPNQSEEGYCDYVLYGRDGKPLAIVEAKKTSVSPIKGRHQVNLYGECMRNMYGYTPILYYTNGYVINIIDGIYPDREISAFHSIEELELLLQRRGRNDITDFRVKESITNRPYQKMAITKICERLNDKRRRGLLVMATGTGKTRVAISLVDVLTRNNWIKNTLFLADRTSLVSQAKRNFVKHLPNMSVCELSGQGDKDMSARLMLSTYQTMINYIDKESKGFTIGRFDLIIIDEAHRSIFNKYSSIFEYFDCVLIGLTATPKSDVDFNTYSIFGCESGVPNFDYSLEEAVSDKFLVNYRLISRGTKLLKRGIKYSELSAEDKRKLEEAFAIEDGETPPPDISSSELFRTIYNEDTCDKILEELMTYGLKINNGEKLGKTIIFAYNHKHAEMIVSRFHALYPSYGANFCQLIDNYVSYANDLIVKFETNKDFQIAVSVDMLDTGIDITDILNLVFFKPVKSKIKFVQMIGRGTRLCSDLFGKGRDKEYFLIFDYCGNFEYFDKAAESTEGADTRSITSRLYDIRTDIMQALQGIEHQEITYNRNYYLAIKELLFNEVKTIRANSARIAVRRNMQYVDKYHDYEVWENVSPVMAKEIKRYISPLIDADQSEDELNKVFDLKMLNVELSIIVYGNAARSSRAIKSIREIAKTLLSKSSVPQVMAKADSLRALASEQLWASPSIERLEQLREDVRDLMHLLREGNGTTSIDINIEDEIEESEGEGGIIDIRTYRERVIDYLIKNLNSEVIKKINSLEPIDSHDLEELERILWQELGSKEEYVKVAKVDNLAVFVRSLIGFNQSAINEKFGDFLNDNILNSRQQEFIKAIINYVRENGDITLQDLMDSPFDNYDLTSLFGDKLAIVMNIVNTMHQAVRVA